METQNLILRIINNEESLYKGDLRYYFKLVFNSPNASNPYHNFRHNIYVTCVTYECAKALRFHMIMGKEKFRALLIAALLHDYDHSYFMIDDSVDVSNAIKAMEEKLLGEDLMICSEIRDYISETEYPRIKHGFSLGGSILRDADASQSLGDVWMQQIIFGLATEMKISPVELLKKEIDYLSNLKFETSWARENFGSMIPARIREVNEYLSILK